MFGLGMFGLDAYLVQPEENKKSLILHMEPNLNVLHVRKRLI